MGRREKVYEDVRVTEKVCRERKGVRRRGRRGCEEEGEKRVCWRRTARSKEEKTRVVLVKIEVKIS